MEWADFFKGFGMNAHTLRAQQTVDRIASSWRGAPPVSVVEVPSDLPVPAPSDARGLYHRGAAWVVSDTQPDTQVARTLAHEAIGHHAMRATLGKSWRPFMHALQDGARAGDQPIRGFRADVARVYVDDKGVCNLSSVQMGDEVAAAVVEDRFNSATGRLEIEHPGHKMARAAVGHVSREMLYLDRPANMNELEGALLIAEHRLRFGGAFFGLGYLAKRWYASTMAKPWNPSSPPMSLRESQNLLKAEKDRQTWWEDIRLVGSAFSGIGGVLLIFIGIIAFFWNISIILDLFR